MAVAVYARSFGFDFVYDDTLQIVQNPWLRSWRFVPRYFTAQVWAFLSGASAGNYWRPVFLLWLRLNYALFGLNPMPWHVVNVMVHAAVTVLVYLFVRRLARNNSVAFIASLVFAVHPVTIETAAWISGVTDSLMSLGIFAALLLWLRASQSQAGRRVLLAFSLAAYAVALLTKETAIVAPALIFLLAYMMAPSPDRLQARVWHALWQVIPYVAVTLLYLLARLAAMHTLYEYANPSRRMLIFTWPSLLLFYLGKLVAPVGLTPWYELRTQSELTLTGVVVPLCVLGLLAGAAYWISRRLRRSASSAHEPWAGLDFAAIASALLLLPLLPALNTRGLPTYDIAHTRYLYLPCAGFAMLLATALVRAAGRLHLPALPHAVAVLVIVAVLAGLTFVQQSYWADAASLLARAEATAPSNPVGWNARGVELARAGMLDDAEQMFLKAAGMAPDNLDVYRNLGYTYWVEGRYPLAETYLQRALKLSPERSDVLQLLAMTQYEEGKLPDAERSIQRAIRLYPDGEDYHFTLGLILEKRGDRAGAIAEYRRELALFPTHKASSARLQNLR